jgi:hypothetical protein
MGEMEWSLMKSRKQEHESIVATIDILGRAGYMVSGISHKNGALEIICHPPILEEDGKEDKFQEAIRQGYGIDESPPSFIDRK